MELDIIHKVNECRFESLVEDKIAYIEYELRDGDCMAILHTIVPNELSGRGIAGIITKFVLDYAKEHNLRIDPVCPYTVNYIEKNTKYKDLL